MKFPKPRVIGSVWVAEPTECQQALELAAL